MWITRYALPFALVLSLLFACLAPKDPEPAAGISAKEILVLAQRAGGRNYTYSQATAAVLASVVVPRPEDGSSAEQLESVLRAAGFSLLPIGPPERAVSLVERAGG